MSTRETGSSGSTTQTLEEPDSQSTADVEPTERDESSSLSLDLIFEVLKNERRREVIRYLRGHEKQVTLSDLAEHIAALENDTDIASITSSQRKRVYVGLYQCHLPKMADMGIVNFNQNRGFVSLGENAPELYQYLDNDTSGTGKWHRYYMGIAGAGTAMFLATVLVGSSTASLAALGAMTLAVAICSVYHAVTLRTDSED